MEKAEEGTHCLWLSGNCRDDDMQEKRISYVTWLIETNNPRNGPMERKPAYSPSEREKHDLPQISHIWAPPHAPPPTDTHVIGWGLRMRHIIFPSKNFNKYVKVVTMCRISFVVGVVVVPPPPSPAGNAPEQQATSFISGETTITVILSPRYIAYRLYLLRLLLMSMYLSALADHPPSYK